LYPEWIAQAHGEYVSRSFRHYWPYPIQGRQWLNLNLPGLVIMTPRGVDPYAGDTALSAVLITACEYWPPGNRGPFYDFRDQTLIRGDANIWVSNIRPYVRRWWNAADPVLQNGGVEFVINVNWFEPLFVATTVTVLDDNVVSSSYAYWR
jgi:hypothetical protein